MRKIIIFISAILLINPLFIYAASIGGALTQGKGKFSIGLDGEYISERKTDNQSFDSAAVTGNPFLLFEENIKLENFWRGTVKLSYGIINNLDVYLRVGESGFNYGRVDIVNGSYPLGALFGDAKIKGANDLVWAAGFKGTYPLPKEWYVGLDGQYLYQNNFYKGSGQITAIGAGMLSMRWGGKMTIQEWHIAPYLAKKLSVGKFGSFTPYVGGRYSYFSLKDKIRTAENSPGTAGIILQNRRYSADKNWGPFCGLDYSLGEHLTFNVEGRFIDENALSFATTYKF